MLILITLEIIIILTISYIIPYLIIKLNSKCELNRIIKQSKKFNHISNLIEIKKYSFKNTEKLMIFFVTISIALIVGLEISNLQMALARLILAIGLILSLSCYINIRQTHTKIINKLYIIKDKANN